LAGRRRGRPRGDVEVIQGISPAPTAGCSVRCRRQAL